MSSTIQQLINAVPDKRVVKLLTLIFNMIKPQITNVTSATITLKSDQVANQTITLNRAAGIAVTLPAAIGSGDKFKVIIGTTVTSNTTTFTCAGSDKLQGLHFAVSDDGAGGPVKGWVATAGTNTVVTFDGTTKGGYVGDQLEFTDVGANRWQVMGLGKQTGTEATPFS